MKRHALAFVLTLAASGPAMAGELKGPARFCGYSPIIDLKTGERIATLEGGIHGGAFQWDGAFGTLKVYGIGWASRPPGRNINQPTGRGHLRFAERKRGGLYEVAIWNRRYGAAYFQSATPITLAMLAAIDRVDLFDEGDDPSGCDLRTTFSWDTPE